MNAQGGQVPPENIRRALKTYQDGRLIQTDGARNDVADTLTYSYYAEDDLSCESPAGACQFRAGDLRYITSANGHKVEFVRYDRAGRVLQSKDENGLVTEFAYDTRGRIVSASRDGAGVSYGYTSAGDLASAEHSTGERVAFEYDAAQRLTRVLDSYGNSIDFSLDASGNHIQESVRDMSGQLQRRQDRIFGPLNRLSTTADSYANPTDFEYDAEGSVKSIVDPLGTTSTYAYDALERIEQTISNAGGAGPERAETRFEYDALDRVTAVVDPKGLTTAYTYNGLGDLVELDSPDTGTTTYTYDSAGNRTGQLDARGVQTNYSYDALNRLTRIDLPTAGQDIDFAYDAVPAICQANETFAAGRLSGYTDASGSTSYCHDRRGNVVRKVQSVAGAPDATVAYAYNSADRLMAVTYPSGATVSYLRDAGGRITGVLAKPTASAAQVAVVSDVDYLPFGPATQFTFGNGRVLAKAFDQNYGIAGITDSALDGMDLDYTLDAVGNVTGLAERMTGGNTATRAIDYDGLDRLTALKDGASTVQAFTYDATGNRASKTAGITEAYTYPTDSHRLTDVGGVARGYDAAGNTTTMGASRAFLYDDRGRLAQLTDGGVPTREYAYNARGERVAKRNPTVSGGDITFVYDESGHLLGEYDASGLRIKEYVWLDDTLVAVLGDHGGSDHQYVLTDHLGTPRAVVHPGSNALLWRWDLTASAFGDHSAQPDPDGDGAGYTFNLRYPGQYFDAESGMHYNYFRDYDPSTGRYVQSDPIGLAGGSSTFGYVSGSPLHGTDPLGLFDVIAGYGCPNGTCGFRYQFNFQSSMGEVWATRSSSAVRSRAAGAAGMIGSALALAQSQVEGNVAASPAGMTDLSLDPWGELTGETLLEQCAAADGGFEDYYNSMYAPGDWLTESQALDLLEQFRVQQNRALMAACRGQPEACRQPFHTLMDFYGLRDPLSPGNPIPRVLTRARGRMDTASNALLRAHPP